MLDYEKEYKALLKRVADLEDTLLKFMRNTKDELENLDIDNFSESFKVKQDKASLEITRTAKELSVKMEEIENGAKKQSEFVQKANFIMMAVSEMQSDMQLYTGQIDVLSNQISLVVTRSDGEDVINTASIVAGINNDNSEVKISADRINLEGVTTFLTPEDLGNNGATIINGSLIQTGTIDADYIDTDDLSCTRMYSSGHKDAYFLKMMSNVGDLGLYAPSAETNEQAVDPKNKDCLWGVYNSDLTEEVCNFYSYGNNFMGYNKSRGNNVTIGENTYIGTTYPKGNWSFGSCVITDWGGNAPVAVFG